MASGGPYVLVVDDDPDIVDSMRFVLEEAGYLVKCALDGREALAVLRRQPSAALVILDLAMPIMNGEAFREEQAKDAAIARVPVIVLSGDGQLPKRGAEGAVLWLRKPIELDELIEAVRSHGAWRAEPSPPHEDGGVDDAR